MKNTPSTRAANLMEFFGWQGGTIHQAAQASGVPVDVLLYGERPCGADPEKDRDNHTRGLLAAETCGLPYRLSLVSQVKGNAPFFIGVADALTEYAIAAGGK